MKDELSYKENPIDKKVNELLRSWGDRQSSRRGFLTKVSKVALGTLVGTTFGMGLPIGGSLLQKAEAVCSCNQAFCGQDGPPICCSGDCGGGVSSCPAGTAANSDYWWSACCNGTIYVYYDCCSTGQTCSGTSCNGQNRIQNHHNQPQCPAGYNTVMCSITSTAGSC